MGGAKRSIELLLGLEPLHLLREGTDFAAPLRDTLKVDSDKLARMSNKEFHVLLKAVTY